MVFFFVLRYLLPRSYDINKWWVHLQWICANQRLSTLPCLPPEGRLYSCFVILMLCPSYGSGEGGLATAMSGLDQLLLHLMLEVWSLINRIRMYGMSFQTWVHWFVSCSHTICSLHITLDVKGLYSSMWAWPSCLYWHIVEIIRYGLPLHC